MVDYEGRAVAYPYGELELGVADADAPRRLHFVDEGLKSSVDHLLTPPRLLLDAGVGPCVASTFAQHDFLSR